MGKFVAEAKPLAERVAKDISANIMNIEDLSSVKVNDSLVEAVRRSLAENGKLVQGDNRYSEDTVRSMVPHLIDYALGEKNFFDQYDFCSSDTRVGSYALAMEKLRENAVFRPIDALTDIIVDERLRLFGPMLASFGYNMHLITLPEFHVTAFHMHDLAKIRESEDERNPDLLNRMKRDVRSMNWNNYQRYDAIIAWIDQLAAENPSVVKLTELGKSHENRRIVMAKIGRSPRGDETRAVWI